MGKRVRLEGMPQLQMCHGASSLCACTTHPYVSAPAAFSLWVGPPWQVLKDVLLTLMLL